jgi:hypothetical protein
MSNNSRMDHVSAPPRAANSLPSALLVGSLLTLLLLSTACNSTTVLQASFNSDTAGSPPASTQAVGTVLLDPGAGSITVVDALASGLAANKWVQISHPTARSQQTGLRGSFSRFDGVGEYGLVASMYIPNGAQLVTVQFETSTPQSSGNFPSFLHLDFMPEGDVRIDDSTVRFGRFPRDQPFVLSVRLVITATSATASITLLGTGASGSIDVPVNPSWLVLARQYGGVRFWMGSQWQGTFFVDDIIVTRKN